MKHRCVGEFEGLDLFNADATEETKIVTTDLSYTIDILSASADKPQFLR